MNIYKEVINNKFWKSNDGFGLPDPYQWPKRGGETGRGIGAGSVFGGARRGGAGRVTDAKRRGEAGVS